MTIVLAVKISTDDNKTVNQRYPATSKHHQILKHYTNNMQKSYKRHIKIANKNVLHASLCTPMKLDGQHLYNKKSSLSETVYCTWSINTSFSPVTNKLLCETRHLTLEFYRCHRSGFAGFPHWTHQLCIGCQTDIILKIPNLNFKLMIYMKMKK